MEVSITPNLIAPPRLSPEMTLLSLKLEMMLSSSFYFLFHTITPMYIFYIYAFICIEVAIIVLRI